MPLAEMQEGGLLDQLDEVQLNVLLSALVYEPRKGNRSAPISTAFEDLIKEAEHYSRMIHRKEAAYHLRPFTKPPYFQLAKAVHAWTRGADFADLFKLTSADEGELVRYLRMIIQLLRELQNVPQASKELHRIAASARSKINRGVVDAEKQLRV